MSGKKDLGRLLTDSLPPMTEREIFAPQLPGPVAKARSAMRAPAVLPQHQHFADTLTNAEGAAQNYSEILQYGIDKLRHERLFPEMLSVDEPMTINTQPSVKSQPSPAQPSPAQPSRSARKMPKAPLKEALHNNPGKLLAQLLTMREAQPTAEPIAPQLPVAKTSPVENNLAEALTALSSRPVMDTSPRIAPVQPKQIEEVQPSGNVQAQAISDVAIPDAAPSSRFVIKRRNDGKIVGMTTPDGEYELERDSGGRVSAINVRKRA